MKGLLGKKLGMTQSVVSRLEDENYGKLNAQTLIDIAKRLHLGLVIKFVDFPTFLKLTDDMSERALRPDPFDEQSLNKLIDTRADASPMTTTDAVPAETVETIKPAPQAFASLTKDVRKRPDAIIAAVQ